MGNSAVDYGGDRFSFATERVALAIEYARGLGKPREWRDAHPAGEGLTLRVGPTRASFYARHRVGGKMTAAKLGPAEGTGRLSVDAARRALQAHKFGAAPTKPTRADTADAGPTLGQVWSDYIAAHAEGRWLPGRRTRQPTDRTILNYRNIHQAHIKAHEASTVGQFAERFPNIHRALREKAPTAADRLRQLVRNIYQYATDTGVWSAINPADGSRATGMIPKHVSPPRTRTLNDAEWARFVRACSLDADPMWGDMFSISIQTLQRMGAVRNMAWADLRETPDGLEWHIPAQFMKGRRGGHTIPLRDMLDVVAILKRRKKVVGGSPYVFPKTSDPATPVPADSYKNAWRRILVRAKLWVADRETRPRPHDLRRTGGERMTLAGVPVQTVCDALGDSPSSVSMVARVYAGVSSKARRDAFAATAKLGRKTAKKKPR